MDANEYSQLETQSETHKRLTPDDVRKYPGLENLSDQQASDALGTLYDLAAILFENHCFNTTTCIDNQFVVDLSQQKNAA